MNGGERPYCEGHYRLLHIRCWRCPVRNDCRFVTAFNGLMEERERKAVKR